MSTSTMTWWSAQNWCKAQTKEPATRASIGCSGIVNNYCKDSDLLTSFVSTWTNGYIWLEDYGDSCNAYYMYLGYSSSQRAYIRSGSAATGWSGYTYALCF